MSTCLPITVSRGCTVQMPTISIWNEDKTELVSLADYKFAFTVKKNYNKDEVDSLILKNTDDFELSGDNDEYASLSLFHEDTNKTPDEYVYDIKAQDPSGNEFQVIEGPFIIKPTATTRTLT